MYFALRLKIPKLVSMDITFHTQISSCYKKYFKKKFEKISAKMPDTRQKCPHDSNFLDFLFFQFAAYYSRALIMNKNRIAL